MTSSKLFSGSYMDWPWEETRDAMLDVEEGTLTLRVRVGEMDWERTIKVCYPNRVSEFVRRFLERNGGQIVIDEIAWQENLNSFFCQNY